MHQPQKIYWVLCSLRYGFNTSFQTINQHLMPKKISRQCMHNGTFPAPWAKYLTKQHNGTQHISSKHKNIFVQFHGVNEKIPTRMELKIIFII